jgi:anti-sigma factor RsiW
MAHDVTDIDLQAYLDGQLDTAGRIEVEAYLQAHPEAAALVMEDLRLRDELRLFLAEADWPAPPATIGLARQLTRALGWRSLGRRLRQGLVAAMLIGAGWLAHAEFALFVDQVAAAHPVPAFADEAAEAYQAVRLKLDAGSNPDPVLLPLAAEHTGGLLPVPTLPGTLRLLGSDLVPWDGGTALLAVYADRHGGVVTLFAAEVDSFAVTAPEAAAVRGLPTVFWQHGPFAYALNGALPAADLLAIARAAAPRPWTGTQNHTHISGETHG